MKTLDIPEHGLLIWVRNFGEVEVFRTRLKDQLRHYIVCLSKDSIYATSQREQLECLHDQHWRIEQYHRIIKQVCNIEKFQVRGKTPILNHFFSALCSYIHLQKMQFKDTITNAYQWKRELYAEVVAACVKNFMLGKEYLNPQFQSTVNV